MGAFSPDPGSIHEKYLHSAWSRKAGAPSGGSAAIATRIPMTEPIGIQELLDEVRHHLVPLSCRVVLEDDPFDPDPHEGLVDVDGVTLDDGDLVLDIVNNFIWVAHAGPWEVSYIDSALLTFGFHGTDVRPAGAPVAIMDGTSNAGSIWHGSPAYQDRYGSFWRRLPIGAAVAITNSAGTPVVLVPPGGAPPGVAVAIQSLKLDVITDPAIHFVATEEMQVDRPGVYGITCSVSLALPVAFAGVIALGLFRNVGGTVTIIEPLAEPFIHLPAGIASSYRLAGASQVQIAAGDKISVRYYHAIGGGVMIGMNDFHFAASLNRRST